MKKLFFVMAAVAALLTSCSKDDTFGGPTRGKVTFEVSTPELATRYGEGTTATALQYAVYDMIEDATNGKLVDTGTATLNDKHANVSIDLVEGRKYTAIFWADAGENASPYTFTPATKTVSYTDVNDLTANNEAYDAFFAFVPEAAIKVGQTVDVDLKRPFAQLNIATNDTVKAQALQVVVENTAVTVAGVYTSFNLATGEVEGDPTTVTFASAEKAEGTITTTTGVKDGTYDMLAMNYVLVKSDTNPLVDVTLNFTDKVGNTEENYVRQYNDVTVKRNHRTNIIGSILTDETIFDVDIEEGFTSDIDEEHNTSETLVVSTADEIIDAFEKLNDNDPSNDPGTIVLGNDIDLNNVLIIGSTSTTNAKAQNSLSTNAVTRTETETPTIVIDGNGKTISSSASRVFRIASSNINVVFSDLTIEATSTVKGLGEYGTPDSNRGISIDTNLQNVSLTLNNCNIEFTDDEVGKDWAYAVNVVGGTGHKITINGGEYEGANVVNVNGSNNIVTVNNATLTSNYPYNEKYYGACIYVKGGQGSRVFAKGNIFNGSHAIAFNIGDTELTESDNIDNCEYVGMNIENGAYKIYNPAGLKNTLETAGAAGAGNTELILMSNIDMTNFEWTPIYVNGYNGAGVVTLNGNDKTITGMKDALFSGGFAGGSGIVIKNLTIKNAKIEVKGNEGTGYGAFICAVDSMPSITLENCHLINSSITGNNGSRVGGLIGWTSGYSNKNDGPVKTYVNIKDCSVIGCTLTNAGSIGAINGHAGASDWTYTTIENCVVENNKLISTDDGDWRVGVVVGTANSGEVIIKNITESGNTLSQTGKTAPEGEKRNYYGRFVHNSTGLLIIDGVATVSSTSTLATALGKGITDINLTKGTYSLPAAIQDKTVTIVGNEETIIKVNKDGTDSQNTRNATIHFEGVKIEGAMDNYRGFPHTKEVSFKNCTIENLVFLHSKATFEGCTFESTAEHCVWTYGAKDVTFTDCTFNYGDRCVNVYVDNGTESVKVDFTNCKFVNTDDDTKGAVEINSSAFPQGANVSLTNCTAPSKGDMVYISEWDPTAGATAAVTVNGETYNTPVHQNN